MPAFLKLKKIIFLIFIFIKICFVFNTFCDIAKKPEYYLIASSFFVQFRDYLVLKTSQIFRDVINPFPDRLEICAFGFIGGIGFILNVLMALSIYSRNSSKADKIKSFG